MTRLTTSAAVFAAGVYIFIFAGAVAWALVSFAGWLFDVFGPWLIVGGVLVLAEVGRREMRRWRR